MMKDEYLWNKTGSDAEIEKLETALIAFRYAKTEPPALPAKTLALPERSRRKFFGLGFAFALASAVIVILSFVWFQIPGSKFATHNDSAKTAGPLSDSIVSPPDVLPLRKIEIPPHTVKPAFTKIRQTNRTPVRPMRTIARVTKVKDAPVKLSTDEKYAYDQLMLALSITSSKLKIVKDKLDGIDEQNAVVEKQP